MCSRKKSFKRVHLQVPFSFLRRFVECQNEPGSTLKRTSGGVGTLFVPLVWPGSTPILQGQGREELPWGPGGIPLLVLTPPRTGAPGGPFWHLFLADWTPGGAWGSPWENPGSTFASRPQKTSKYIILLDLILKVILNTFFMFLRCFSSEFFKGLWTTCS